MNLIIGVDFDNTIVSYDELIYNVALDQGLIDSSIKKSKKYIRDTIRQLPNGEVKWQQLQAIVYGRRIMEAKLTNRISKFFNLCRKNNVKLYIISHKTEFANYDETKTNLRLAALDWMKKNKFFDKQGLSFPRENIYFHSTREDKIKRIEQLKCTHFIDDLEETYEEKSFPNNVKKILFDPNQEHSRLREILIFHNWGDINEYFFKSDNDIENKISLISQIIGNRVISTKRIGDGRNSKVYLITCKDKKFSGKFYFQDKSEKRQRMSIEFSSMKFLWNNGIRAIPQPILIDKDHNFALYEYVEGLPIKSDDITIYNIDYATDFLKNLDALKIKKESGNLNNAAEACFSIKQIVENIENRYKILISLPRNNANNKILFEFLKNEYLPAFKDVVKWCKSNLNEKLNYELEIGKENRTLSPSDFGFHNSIRRHDGKIIFLDFEYFGWDDPAKMISDFLLHPNMDLSEQLKKRFLSSIILHFSKDSNLKKRLKITFPLFGLKWCMIFLNEFLPNQFLRREFAHKDELVKSEVQEKQLLKAKELLYYINKNYKKFPYEIG